MLNTTFCTRPINKRCRKTWQWQVLNASQAPLAFW